MHFQRVPWRVAAISASLTALCLAQNAQNTAELTQQDTPLTFSTATNLVLVPVVVRNAQGHAIGTLTKDNFQLFDKGKPVTITKFSVEKAETPPILPDTSIETDAKGNPQPRPAGPAGKPVASHFIMWLFDDLHLSFGDLAQTREAAKKVLKDSFEPGTRAAIYTTSNATSLDFTDDVDKLNATLDQIRPWPTLAGDLKPCPAISFYEADRIINGNDQDALAVAEDDMQGCPDVLLTLSNGPAGQAQANPTQLASLVRMDALKELSTGFQDTRNVLLVLKGLVRRMAAMPGSRNIVLVSPGFYLITDHRTDEMDVFNNAIRSNVVISSLDARGLYALTPGQRAEDDPVVNPTGDPNVPTLKANWALQVVRADQDILEELARATGGNYFHDNNDFYGGLKLVATQPEYIYVLGFAPEKLKFDGSYHSLKVTLVNAGKPEIQARRGYFERKHMENAAEEAKEDIQEAFFSRDEMRELPVELHTQFFKTSDEKATLSILARIDAKHLHYKKDDGRNDDTLTVVGGVFDRNGNFVVGTQKVVNLRLKDQTLSALPAGGITVKTNLDVSIGDYIVRLVVRDSEGQIMAALNSAVNIP